MRSAEADVWGHLSKRSEWANEGCAGQGDGHLNGQGKRQLGQGLSWTCHTDRPKRQMMLHRITVQWMSSKMGLTRGQGRQAYAAFFIFSFLVASGHLSSKHPWSDGRFWPTNPPGSVDIHSPSTPTSASFSVVAEYWVWDHSSEHTRQDALSNHQSAPSKTYWVPRKPTLPVPSLNQL